MAPTNNLDSLNLNNDTKQIIMQLLNEIRAENIITNKLKPIKNSIVYEDHKVLSLENLEEIFITGFGKASAQMAHAFLPILEKSFSGRISGQIITKYGHKVLCDPLQVFEAGHPIPDQNSIEATQRVLVELSERKGRKSHIFCLVSGGASSLLTLPVSGISLEDKIQTSDILLKSGADIREINAIRKHISQVKGGRLAERISPLPITSLILSDVVGDDVGSVGSGPTVADQTTYSFCLDVIRRYKLKLPLSVFNYLQDGVQGKNSETPKPNSFKAQVENLVIGNLKLALSSLRRSFERFGYKLILVEEPLTGQNSEAVGYHVRRLVALKRDGLLNGLFCMVSGGETTIKVRGSGKGGRNLEFALETGLRLYQEGFRHFEVISLGTDGTDGFTDAAGGCVTDAIFKSSSDIELGWSHLSNNDSYTFLASRGGLIFTGPTGSNINDVHIIVLR